MQEPVQKSQTEADDWLSALFDGELSDQGSAESIGRLARDEALKARWSEYCLIGDAMRGQGRPSTQAVARLRATLEPEPTVLAPVTRQLRQQPMLWLAAAATVTAVTWMVLKAAPTDNQPVQFAAQPSMPQSADISPYLAAHQDYAQALTSTPEMHFSQVALSVPGAAR